jgi:uncharacterized protein (DUF302 family)
MAGHGYVSAGPPTEVYFVGPDTAPAPTAYRTEVRIPVMPSIALTVHLDQDFAAALARTKDALRAKGFGVLSEIDVRATLRFRVHAAIEEYVILGACHPELARQALDIDRQTGLLLPCNVVVRTEPETGGTLVETLDPAILVRATGLAGLSAVAAEIRRRLDAVLASLSETAA